MYVNEKHVTKSCYHLLCDRLLCLCSLCFLLSFDLDLDLCLLDLDFSLDFDLCLSLERDLCLLDLILSCDLDLCLSFVCLSRDLDLWRSSNNLSLTPSFSLCCLSFSFWSSAAKSTTSGDLRLGDLDLDLLYLGGDHLCLGGILGGGRRGGDLWRGGDLRLGGDLRTGGDLRLL